MAWAYLIAAGLFEIGWPIGLKWAQAPGKLIIGVVVAVVSMALSGVLLFLAQREIELGVVRWALLDRKRGEQWRHHPPRPPGRQPVADRSALRHHRRAHQARQRPAREPAAGGTEARHPWLTGLDRRA